MRRQLHNLIAVQILTLSSNIPLRKVMGSSLMIQWNYRAIFNHGWGNYRVSNRRKSVVLESCRVQESHRSKIESILVIPLTALMISAESEDDWKTFTKTIDTLESPVFAIDKAGVVITWNKAMEQLTGFQSKKWWVKEIGSMRFHSYGEPRPMLVDYIVISTDKRQSGKFPGIKRIGKYFYR
ncbi:MAG: PAS domain-containing protein [Ignavibacteriales bacterium]|nr:PAS domain-containing protein [Ignavibacteriales bacterium]